MNGSAENIYVKGSAKLDRIMKQLDHVEGEVATLEAELTRFYATLVDGHPNLSFHEAEAKMTMLFTKKILLETLRAQSFEQVVSEAYRNYFKNTKQK